MADPLSIAASLGGLLSLGLQATEYLYNYYTAYRGRDQDLNRTADQLGDLFQSLRTIDQVVRQRKWQPSEQGVLQSIEKSILRCEDIFHDLEDETRKFMKEPSHNVKKSIIIVGRRIAYPLRRSTLTKLSEDIHDIQDNLAIALHALQLKEHQRTQDDLREVTSILKNLQAQRIGADLEQWLRAPDASVDLNLAISRRHMGTGQWLIDDPTFETWLQRDNSFLWLYGFAGCGKSVLCSTAIQHVFRYHQARFNSAMGFFFFTFNDESKRDTSGALRTLLSQLCGQIAGLREELTCLKQSISNRSPSVDALLVKLRYAIMQCRHCFIIMDALDESPLHTSRQEVLSMVETMRQWQLPGLHLLVTSRDLPDIREHFQSVLRHEEIEAVGLNNEGIQQDILRYVSYQFDHDRQLQRWGNHRERIETHLVRHADGVFRWVDCQLQPLRQSPKSERHLTKCLRSLPKSLDETYERILCSIGEESRDEAQQILALLCYSVRPLSIDEVIEATAIDLDLLCYDNGKRLIDTDDLHRVCPGLLSITLAGHADSAVASENDKKTQDIVGASEVRIAHFSVQEYLMSDRIKQSHASGFALPDSAQHGHISKLCLLYLTNDDFAKQALTETMVEQYCFARYAARNWFNHYQRADCETTAQLTETVLRLLTEDHTFENWIRLYDPDQPWKEKISYEKAANDCASSIYYAAWLGIDDVLMTILARSSANVNATGGKFGSPLQAASFNGHVKTVNILLNNGADANAKGGRFGSALPAAVFSGHEAIVQALLENGAEVNAQGGQFYANALQAASYFGREKIVQMLLNAGADLSVQTTRYDNALQSASVNGHLGVVKILLSAGADVNLQVKAYYANALQAASAQGHERIVQVLLEHGANINAEGGRAHASTIQAASDNNHKEIVRMLLERGANVDTGDGKLYKNLLMRASSKGHEVVVQMLLDKAARTGLKKGKLYDIALLEASVNGHDKVVQILLTAGANVNACDDFGRTSLVRAIIKGQTHISRLLVQSCADITISDNCGRTATDWLKILKTDVELLDSMCDDVGSPANPDNEKLRKYIALLSAIIARRPPKNSYDQFYDLGRCFLMLEDLENASLAFQHQIKTFKSAENAVHNVRCDSCTAIPIEGIRFICMVCPYTDLCMLCMGKYEQSGGLRHCKSHKFTEFSPYSSEKMNDFTLKIWLQKVIEKYTGVESARLSE